MQNEERLSSTKLNSLLESQSHDPVYDVDGFSFDRRKKSIFIEEKNRF